MAMGRFADREGREIDGLAWARLKSDPGYVLVEQTEFDDGGLVRTTWEGLTPGVIFLTVSFYPEAGCSPTRVRRAETEVEARADHADLVVELRGEAMA